MYVLDPGLIAREFVLTCEVFAQSLLDVSRIVHDQWSKPFLLDEYLVRGLHVVDLPQSLEWPVTKRGWVGYSKFSGFSFFCVFCVMDFCVGDSISLIVPHTHCYISWSQKKKYLRIYVLFIKMEIL